ncbi:MAG: BlaI/MecI/CopY family transcriptional regulator [Actinobacteria bacterium]|nr:BlaI/MecI/CopY family transcriptional regulator [Actinomycetota bacterium]
MKGMDIKMNEIRKSRKKSQKFGLKKINSISDLETEIMNIIWERGTTTVREVHEVMLKKEMGKKDFGFIPYATVMSTMTTLAEKGLLKQDKSSKTFTYSAAIDSKSLSRKIMESVADKLLDKSTKEMIFRFLSYTSEVPEEKILSLLDKIEKIK